MIFRTGVHKERMCRGVDYDCASSDEMISEVTLIVSLHTHGLPLVHRSHGPRSNSNPLETLSRSKSIALDKALASFPSDRYMGRQKGMRSLGRKLSRKLSGQKMDSQWYLRDLTREVGSYSYMAPEVLEDDKYNEKADIFSFGCCIYNVFYRTIPSLLVVAESGMEEEALYLYAWKVSNG